MELCASFLSLWNRTLRSSRQLAFLARFVAGAKRLTRAPDVRAAIADTVSVPEASVRIMSIHDVNTMSVQEVSAEEFAKLFHHYHEALAPDFHCNRNGNGEMWSEVPVNERSRMIAAVRLVLLDLRSRNTATENDRERLRQTRRTRSGELKFLPTACRR